MPKRPRQKALPGLEDRGIAEIERAAHAYVDARDARMSMGEEEQRRHTKLVAVMHKHSKKTYVHRDGGEVIDIRLTVKDPEEKAKVRIKSADEYTEPATEPEEGEQEEGEPEEPEVEMEIEGGDEAGIE